MQTTTATTGGCPEVSIVGEWLSEGENVAPLLVTLNDITSATHVYDETTFEIDYTYSDASMSQVAGTWTSEPCPGHETKHHIVLEQTSPGSATVAGIYEIDGCMNPAVMRYEVANDDFPTPTCDDDFGTGMFGPDIIQIFVRQ